MGRINGEAGEGSGKDEKENLEGPHARQEILPPPRDYRSTFAFRFARDRGFYWLVIDVVDEMRAISWLARDDESRRAGTTGSNRHTHSHVLPRSEGCGRRFLPDPYSYDAQTSPPSVMLRCALREGGGL